MKKFSALLPVVLAYAPFAGAYSTSVTVLAGANGAYGSQQYDTDFQKVENENSASTASALADYDVFNSSGVVTFQYHAAANGQASPGVLRADATAYASAYAANIANSQAIVKFYDTITLAGPANTYVDVTLSYLVSGGLLGDAGAKGGVSIFYGGAAAYSMNAIEFSENSYTPRTYTCTYIPSCAGVATFSLPTNIALTLGAYLDVGAGATGDRKPTDSTSIADFSHTGRVFLDIADDRYQLITNSGYNYSPVPLPASLWLFSGALGICGVAGRYQRANASAS